MTIKDDRLEEGEKAVREELADFMDDLTKSIGKRRGGCHTLKVIIDEDGYIEAIIREPQAKRRIRPHKK